MWIDDSLFIPHIAQEDREDSKTQEDFNDYGMELAVLLETACAILLEYVYS